jgi:hypothetical protein
VNDNSSKVAAVLKEAWNEATVQAAKSTRTSLSYQTNGTRVQDKIALDLKQHGMEQPCPICNHTVCKTLQTSDGVATVEKQPLQVLSKT